MLKDSVGSGGLSIKTNNNSKPKHVVSPTIVVKDRPTTGAGLFSTTTATTTTATTSTAATTTATRAVADTVVARAAVGTALSLDSTISSYQQHPSQDVTVVVPKSRSSSFKKVSFGDNSGTVVETFVYESAPLSEDYVVHNRLHSPPPPPSTPTKLLVELVNAQIPACIAPPSEISVVLYDGTVTAASLIDYHQGVATTITSPQIPSLRKMEDHENPFRPEGNLRTEVAPIIEGFKAKPYHPPDGPAANFPYPQPPAPAPPVLAAMVDETAGTVDLVKSAVPSRPQNVVLSSSDSSDGSSRVLSSPQVSAADTTIREQKRPLVENGRATAAIKPTTAAPVIRAAAPAAPHAVREDTAHKMVGTTTATAPMKPSDITLYVNNAAAAASSPTSAVIEVTTTATASNGFGSSPQVSAAQLTTNIVQHGNQKMSAEVQHKMLTPPKAGQVEMVNLDGEGKRKRCCPCCTIM